MSNKHASKASAGLVDCDRGARGEYNRQRMEASCSVIHTIHGTSFCYLSAYVCFEFVLAHLYGCDTTFAKCGLHIETKQVQVMTLMSFVQKVRCEFLGLPSVVNEVSFLLGCDSVSLGIWFPTFRNVRNHIPSDVESNSRTHTGGSAFFEYQPG